MKAPVVLFVYNRVDKVKACLMALEQNLLVEETNLYIFSDGNKSEEDKKQVNEVRNYLHQYKKNSKFKNVCIEECDKNRGLASAIINGVSYVIDKYGKVIVVEDDLLVAKDFLKYMNDALDYYELDDKYGSISAFTYPLKSLERYEEDIYVLRKGECWGWATWKDRWGSVDWNVSNYEEIINNRKNRKEFNKLQYDFSRLLIRWKQGKTNSWAIRWCLHLFINKQLTVYPRVSRVENIGFDGSGTNCGSGVIRKSGLSECKGICHFKFLNVDTKIEKEMANYEKTRVKDIIQIVLNKIFV